MVVAFLPITTGAPGATGTNVANNMAYWSKNSNFTPGAMLTAFCTCFYYFTGFESFATSAATIKEPEKNMGKGIMIVIITATLFYLLESIIFMMALSPANGGGISQNMSTGF
ncbi:hypothetical protein FACS1894218_3520 [Bacilli bacterium]|nr:hypothetical protein FACS1894218_3520 [Bacilli bacterium]